MSTLPISALPLKTGVAATDILLLVDAQFGADNYISKRTTVGDIIELANTYFVVKTDVVATVSTVNGQSGNVVLTVSSLEDTVLSNPATDDILAYSATLGAWFNKSLENEILDCGTF